MTLSKPGFWDRGHVSRNINATCCKGAPEGSILEIESKVQSIGSRLGIISCVIRIKGTDTIVTFGTHDKAVVANKAIPFTKEKSKL